MLARTEHLFDEATRVSAGDSRWQGQTSDDYWAFVGPFGGVTAATVLRAVTDHPERSGDPLSLTVNYCAPIASGVFDLDVRLVKGNRSTQHWCVELTQGSADVATFATLFSRSGVHPGHTSPRNFRWRNRSSKYCPTPVSPRPG
jgi:acyl-CoA thioesterase